MPEEFRPTSWPRRPGSPAGPAARARRDRRPPRDTRPRRQPGPRPGRAPLADRGNGSTVTYAIADVGAFVPLGRALDREARRRGQTLYSPDAAPRCTPPELSEGGQPAPRRRPTRRRLDATSMPTAAGRGAGATDGSVAARSWTAIRGRGQADAGTLPEPLALLPRVGSPPGTRRASRSCSAPPTRRCGATPDDATTLAFQGDLPVEAWNAQISLLTGRCAAASCSTAAIGVLRTSAARRTSSGSGWHLRPRWASCGLRRLARRGDLRLDRDHPRQRRSSTRGASCCAGAPTRRSTATPPDQTQHGGVGAADATSPRPAAAGRPLRHRGVPGSGRRRRARTRAAGRLRSSSLEGSPRPEEGLLEPGLATVGAFAAVVVDAEDGRHRVLDGHAVRGAAPGCGLTPGTRAVPPGGGRRRRPHRALRPGERTVTPGPQPVRPCRASGRRCSPR